MTDSSPGNGAPPPARTGVRPRRVRMSDVARAAGVSAAAVSYAFSGAPGVSEERRRHILEVAEEMGFRPSQTARDLRSGTTRTIGLLLADIANPFYAEVAAGVVAEATERGYEVSVAHVGVDGARQADAAYAQVDRNCSGLIFTGLVAADRPLLKTLRHEGIPIVQVYRKVAGEHSDWVGVDDYAGGFEIASHVIATGRRRIALIGGPEASSASAGRMHGYQEALRRAGLTAVNEPDVWGELSRASGALRARAALAEHPDIDAFICGNDVIALGVLDVCTEVGRRVPEDIAISGFDDMSFSSAGPLQLSTVTVPRDALGRRAAIRLLRRIEGEDGEPQDDVLPYVIQIRNTTVAQRGR